MRQYSFDLVASSGSVAATTYHRYLRSGGQYIAFIFPVRGSIKKMKLQAVQAQTGLVLPASFSMIRFWPVYDETTLTTVKWLNVSSLDTTAEMGFVQRDNAYLFQGYENEYVMNETCMGIVIDLAQSTYPVALTAGVTINYSIQIFVE